MANSSKKYKLRSVAPDGSKPPCAFFVSAAGCHNGDKCKFAHDQALLSKPSGGGPGSVVSSESSHGDREEEIAQKVPETLTTQVNKKKRNQSTSTAVAASDAFPFANPKSKKQKASEAPPPTATTEKAPSAKKEKQKQKQTASADNITTNSKPAVVAKKVVASTQNNSTPSYLALLKDMPVCSFTMPGTEPPAAETPSSNKKKPTVTNNNTRNASSSDNEDAEPPLPSLPLPQSTAQGRRWLAAVEQGRKHPRFSRDYNFEKYQKEDEEAGFVGKKAWITAKPFDASVHKDLPQVLAMDCEMCETQDPVSGKKDPRALCRISVVDVATDTVLLDTLVKPAWPVTDYRTWVNGITEQDLANVQFTLRHAQAFMMALCSEETVFVGHALQNDFAAIRMEHYCAADSALLFTAKDSPSSSVSLKDLAASVLKQTMPEKHDSVNDARTSWLCLEHYLKCNGKVEPIERSARTVRHTYGLQLFVHRIPKSCDETHLTQMFLAYTSIQPEKVDDIEYNGDNGKTIVTFRSTAHANIAFDTIEGKSDADPSGRLQKKVFLKSGSYIRVRKMAFEKKDDGNKEPPRRSSTG